MSSQIQISTSLSEEQTKEIVSFIEDYFAERFNAIEKEVLDMAIERVEALVGEETVFGITVLSTTAVIAAIKGVDDGAQG